MAAVNGSACSVQHVGAGSQERLARLAASRHLRCAAYWPPGRQPRREGTPAPLRGQLQAVRVAFAGELDTARLRCAYTVALPEPAAAARAMCDASCSPTHARMPAPQPPSVPVRPVELHLCCQLGGPRAHALPPQGGTARAARPGAAPRLGSRSWRRRGRGGGGDGRRVPRAGRGGAAAGHHGRAGARGGLEQRGWRCWRPTAALLGQQPLAGAPGTR